MSALVAIPLVLWQQLLALRNHFPDMTVQALETQQSQKTDLQQRWRDNAASFRQYSTALEAGIAFREKHANLVK